MPRISQLPSLTVPDNADELAIVDTSASVTKKITRSALLSGAPLPNNTVTTSAITDGSVTKAKVDYTTMLINGTERVVGNDGTRPIYQKFLTGNANFSSTGAKNIAHGITGLLQVIQINASLSLGNNTDFQVLPHIEPTQSCAILYNNTNVVLSPTFAWGATIPYRILITYTRS